MLSMKLNEYTHKKVMCGEVVARTNVWVQLGAKREPNAASCSWT